MIPLTLTVFARQPLRRKQIDAHLWQAGSILILGQRSWRISGFLQALRLFHLKSLQGGGKLHPYCPAAKCRDVCAKNPRSMPGNNDFVRKYGIGYRPKPLVNHVKSMVNSSSSLPISCYIIFLEKRLVRLESHAGVIDIPASVVK